MNKNLVIALISGCLIFNSVAYGQEIKLNGEKSQKLTDINNKAPKKMEGKLYKSEKEQMEYAFQAQKEMDVEDIRKLWEATVARNSVIKFALTKLALPAESRRIHSSLMAKSVSALISGVTILPGLLGADSVTSTASAASGSMISRAIRRKGLPSEMPLSDTELIHLAGLVEELQNKIIKNYYEYKSSIEALSVCRQNLLLQNKNYSDALNSKDEIQIIVSSAEYDKELLNELKLKQKIKLYRLELERLAGSDVIAGLNLTKVASLDKKD